VLENRVLRRIFGPKRDEVTREWRTLHNDGLIFRVTKLSTYGESRDVYRVLAGKPEGMRPFGRSKRRLENIIKMNLQEVGCWAIDWIG